MRLVRLEARRGSRLSRRPAMPASALLLVAYAVLHLVLFGFSGAMLDLAGLHAFWSGRTGLGMSLLDASQVVTALLALLIAVEELQAWSRRERRLAPALVGYLVTLLLLHGLSEYFRCLSGVVERMAW
jgi:hypothetical protein